MILSTLTIINKTIQDKASSRANFLLKTTAFFIKKKKFLSDLSKWSLKKRKKINSFKQKKPHVFVFHSSTYTVTNEIFQKEKKNDQHWLGYLFPSVQLTFDSDYWCGIVVSSNKHDDLIFIYAFLLKSHLFFFFFSLKSFWIIAKQSFSLQKCTLTRLFGFRRKPACLFTEYAGTMQNQVAARVL